MLLNRLWTTAKWFDVPTGRALVGDELGHSADARHATDRRRAFT